MSTLSIAQFFPFHRIRIVHQSVSSEATIAWIEAVPDERFHPICYLCGSRALQVHSQQKRTVPNLKDVLLAAVYALGKIKDSRTVEPLIAALKDKDKEVRRVGSMGVREAKRPKGY